jgi:hypothetical protein
MAFVETLVEGQDDPWLIPIERTPEVIEADRQIMDEAYEALEAYQASDDQGPEYMTESEALEDAYPDGPS